METPERTTGGDGPLSREELGRAAYEGYGTSVGWVTYDGSPMPTWEEQDPKRRAAWMAAGARVARHMAIRGDAVERRG